MDQPFWNMLSVSPVLYQGNVVFYMVRRAQLSRRTAASAASPLRFRVVAPTSVRAAD